MKKVLLIGGFGAIAWWLLRGTTDAGTPATSADNSSASQAAAGPNLKEEILRRSAGDAAIVDGLANSHVWGYYWAQVKGTPAPSPDRIGFADGNALISLDTYLAGYSRLSGLGRWR